MPTMSTVCVSILASAEFCIYYSLTYARVLPGGELFRSGGAACVDIACAQQLLDVVCLAQPKFKRLLPHLVDTTHCEYNAGHNLALSLASV